MSQQFVALYDTLVLGDGHPVLKGPTSGIQQG